METLETLYTNLIQQHEHIQAANPWGCNQYGHRKGHQGGESSGSSPEQENSKAGNNFVKAKENTSKARKKISDLDQEKEKALRNGDNKKAQQIEKELSAARKELEEAKAKEKKAKQDYSDAYNRLRESRKKQIENLNASNTALDQEYTSLISEE